MFAHRVQNRRVLLATLIGVHLHGATTDRSNIDFFLLHWLDAHSDSLLEKQTAKIFAFFSCHFDYTYTILLIGNSESIEISFFFSQLNFVDVQFGSSLLGFSDSRDFCAESEFYFADHVRRSRKAQQFENRKQSVSADLHPNNGHSDWSTHHTPSFIIYCCDRTRKNWIVFSAWQIKVANSIVSLLPRQR